MATGTAGTAARQFHTQHVHYLRKAITFADRATTVTIGTIPSGSVINFATSGVFVHTVFNGGTNNRLDVGDALDTGTNNYGTLLSLLTMGFVPLDEGANTSSKVSVDTAISAYVDVTGTTPTTGDATIVIAYFPDL